MALPRVLDRIPHFDERSKQYPIRTLLLPTVTRTKKIWAVPPDVLDQGSEGACVGFGWSGELAATPVTAKELPGSPTIDNAYALDVYHRAQAEDRAMGNNWPEGASVLAGAKAVTKLNLITEYRWAFGIDDAIDAIVGHGPVVLGINWYNSMFNPDARGYMTVSGSIAGGHCIVAYGYMPNDPVTGSDTIWLRNSWGPGWGVNGTAYIRSADLARLLSEQGEACIPTDRSVISPTDTADQQLVAQLTPWAATRRFGANEQARKAYLAWKTAKGL